LPTPMPAITSEARPTSVRNCPMRSMKRRVLGAPSSRVLISQAALGNWPESLSPTELGSAVAGSFSRYFPSNRLPGWIRLVARRLSSEVIATGPRDRPSLSRSGSSAIIPEMVKLVSPKAIVSPMSSERRCMSAGVT